MKINWKIAALLAVTSGVTFAQHKSPSDSHTKSEILKRFDTDGDGKLSAEERHAAHKKMAEQHNAQKKFNARQIDKKATITLNGPLEKVWPLFDPLNEGKWAAAWQPEILYPTDGTVREGMVCRTHGHDKKSEDDKLIWVVSRYDTENHRITYTVVNPHKTFTVDVKCSKHDASHTDATITYSFVGLTDLGNKAVERSAEHLFKSDLRDWQKAINHFLKTGKTLQNPHGNGH